MRKPRVVNLQHEVSVWEVGLAKLQGEVSARKGAIADLLGEVSARKVAIADLQGEVSEWYGGPAEMILLFSLSLDVN